MGKCRSIFLCLSELQKFGRVLSSLESQLSRKSSGLTRKRKNMFPANDVFFRGLGSLLAGPIIATGRFYGGFQYPSEHFTKQEPQNPSLEESNLYKTLRSTDFETKQLCNDQSGWLECNMHGFPFPHLSYLFGIIKYLIEQNHTWAS